MPDTNGPTPDLPISGKGFQVGLGLSTEPILGVQPTPTAKTAAATLTAAELMTGIITYTGAAANLTLPTVTLLEDLIGEVKNDTSFEFSLIDLGGAGQPTIVVGTGWTLVGDVSPASGTAQKYRARKTAAGAWTLYQIG